MASLWQISQDKAEKEIAFVRRVRHGDPVMREVFKSCWLQGEKYILLHFLCTNEHIFYQWFAYIYSRMREIVTVHLQCEIHTDTNTAYSDAT